MSEELWHPKATRVQIGDAGPFIQATPKLIWHTTEGSTAIGAIAAYRAGGNDAPHFTIEIGRLGRVKLYQHVALNRASSSLQHPSGTPETNHAHCIQVEIVGFSAESHKWSRFRYRALARLARWIERNAGVERKAYHPFPGEPGYHRLSPEGFVNAHGHLGHCHVPNNNHVDPGAIRIEGILK